MAVRRVVKRRMPIADIPASIEEELEAAPEREKEKARRRWRKDAGFRDRVLETRRLLLRGHRGPDILPRINEWCARVGQPSVTMTEVWADIKRVHELWEEEREKVSGQEEDLRGRRLAELDGLIVQAQELLAEAPPNSVNRANLVQAIRQTIMDKAKLEGLLQERVKQEVTVHDGDKRLREEVEALLAARGARFDEPVGAVEVQVAPAGKAIAVSAGRGGVLGLPSGQRDGQDAIGN